MKNGYYDDGGRWRRIRNCMTPCRRCNCQPPGGVEQLRGDALERHQEARRQLKALAPKPSVA